MIATNTIWCSHDCGSGYVGDHIFDGVGKGGKVMSDNMDMPETITRCAGCGKTFDMLDEEEDDFGELCNQCCFEQGDPNSAPGI